LKELAERHAALVRPEVTPYLVLNPTLRRQKLANGVAVRSYSGYDPLVLNEDLHEVLSLFKADEPVAATLARLKAEHDVDFPPELLRELWMHEVVVPPPPREKTDEA
jgi:hypothetical protein